MFFLKNRILTTCVFSLILVTSSVVFAGDFPSRTIEIVVPHPPGGGGERFCQLFKIGAEKYFDKEIVVITKPGAGGLTGLAYFNTTPKDGHTIIEVPCGLFSIKSMVVEEDERWTIEDYEYICGMTNNEVMFAVHSSSPYKSLKDVVKTAKNDELVFGVNAIGSIVHLAAVQFAQESNIMENIVIVPTGGQAPTAQQLLGRHIDIAVTELETLEEHVKAGTVRILAFASEERVERFPEVPTAIEEGYPDIVHYIWMLFLAHKDIPEEHLNKWIEVAEKVLNDEEWLKMAERAAIPIKYRNPEEVREQLEREFKIYGEILKTIELTL